MLRVTLYLPIAIMLSSLAIGWFIRQRKVVRPSRVLVGPGSPLASTVSPFGTVMVWLYVALSLGVSFTGKYVAAPIGWLSATAPSLVATQPETPSAGSSIFCGTPA